MAQVLIIDDSPVEVRRLKSILQQHGHSVITANNGGRGVALCRDEQPDVVLMDIVMPGINGFQATRQLAKDPLTECIPVVIITTKDQIADKLWGMRQGASEYLTKPVNKEMLLAVVGRLVETVE